MQGQRLIPAQTKAMDEYWLNNPPSFINGNIINQAHSDIEHMNNVKPSCFEKEKPFNNFVNMVQQKGVDI